MRIKLPHIPYITNKIMLDIAHSSFVEIKDNIEKLNPCIKQILESTPEIFLDSKDSMILLASSASIWVKTSAIAVSFICE